jgi:copper homeostasis protein (lipoprotein)
MTDSRLQTLIVAALLIACSAVRAQAPQVPALDLPATFTGDLPCADCTAIRHHLDLWPDGVFHLHREWVGRKLTRDELGRWQLDAKTGALLLQGSAEKPSRWEVKGPRTLRQLDQQGAPIVSNLPYELASTGQLAAARMSLLMGGEMTYMADSLRITECLTGRNYPVAQEGESRVMERAYVGNVQTPGAPLYVTLEGSIEERPKIEGAGTRANVVVQRFINSWPAQSCERARADSALVGTHWKFVRMAGNPVRVIDSRREPSLALRSASDLMGSGRPGYSATVGCNQLGGTYDVKGDGLTFGAGISTLMACAPPLGDMERRLAETLSRTRRWQVTGPTLELIDEQGQSLALLEAVYLK